MCDNHTHYECSNKGLLFPLVNECFWPVAGRATIYFIGLLWCFLGVAIIADIFMCSIEKITSRTTTIKVASQESEKGYDEIEVKVWNDTVANLTLMALGSSAPEILLSCIEVVGNGFEAGALGPGTIVGSAAFNLLCIIAVCVMSIPSPDVRRIKAIKVFGITAFFSIFAYVWLIIILVAVTPGVVELWEAILTFLFFPILVLLAYLADRDFCMKKKVDDANMELGFAGSKLNWKQRLYRVVGSEDEKSRLYAAKKSKKKSEKKMRDLIKELKKVHPHLSEEEVVQIASTRLSEEEEHSHLWYRINATRKMGGAPKLMPTMNEELQDVYEHLKELPEEVEGEEHIGSTADFSEGGTKAVIEFTASRCAVMENEGRVSVGIRRYGKMNSRIIFRFDTIDGTAESEKDYIPIKQTMVFEKDEALKHVDVVIIDDNEWEPDEIFFCKLALDPDDPSYETTVIGKKPIQEITIINDDEPGTFQFSKPSLLFKESAGKALIPIERVNGADGKVNLKWKTEDMSAHSGKDYEGGSGTLTFEHGETTKTLEMNIFDDQAFEKDECFKVELLEVDNGGKLGRVVKTIVTIVNDDEFNGMVSRLVNMTNMNMDSLKVDSTTWADQFHNAMNVNGGNIEGATHMDYLMHFLTFGWKIVFAIVPPVSIWGGWLSFIIALIMIGILTAIVGDLAGIFGCLVGLEDSVTAITFVALGTSLPDLFASKQAATQEKTADNSVGNVTGSNSVNVFLGLGLPWLIASIYWTAQNKQFEVPTGSLVFSVACYSVAAIMTVALLMAKRYLKPLGHAELGGPMIPKVAIGVALIFLWISYVLLSSLQAYGHIKTNF